MAGRPKNRSKAVPLQVSLPAETHDYLVLLATLGKIATIENDVAVHILVREVRQMQKDGFHKEIVPKAK
jgi:hypothetical protein